VKAGRIERTCEIESPFGQFKPTLEPVAYRRGSVLNPLHPVNRVTGVKAGQHWRVPLVDPFGDALKATVAQMAGGKSPGATAEPVARFLDAEVLAQPQNLEWEEGVQTFLVIEYTAEDYTA